MGKIVFPVCHVEQMTYTVSGGALYLTQSNPVPGGHFLFSSDTFAVG